MNTDRSLSIYRFCYLLSDQAENQQTGIFKYADHEYSEILTEMSINSSILIEKLSKLSVSIQLQWKGNCDMHMFIANGSLLLVTSFSGKLGILYFFLDPVSYSGYIYFRKAIFEFLSTFHSPGPRLLARKWLFHPEVILPYQYLVLKAYYLVSHLRKTR